MNRPNAFDTGVVRPHSYGMAVPLGNHHLRVEVHGLSGDGMGLQNDDGYVAVVPNGVGEGRNTNGLMARQVVRTARDAGIDVSVVTYDDPESYQQDSYTETMVAVGTHVRQRAQGKMVWLPHSRGGISLTHGKDALLDAGAIQGVFGMANPCVPIGRYEDAWSFIREVRAALSTRPSAEAAAVYAGFVRNIGTLAMRPYPFGDMVAEIVRSDVSELWSELSQAGVPVTLAQYSADALVSPRRNLAAMRSFAAKSLFKGTVMELPGGHARPLLDPSHAHIIVEQALQQHYTAAA